MSETNPEDTGQISVAELLARNGQQTNLSAGGRRRRGVKGGISVAELTGEIPVVRDEPGSRSAPVVEEPTGGHSPVSASEGATPGPETTGKVASQSAAAPTAATATAAEKAPQESKATTPPAATGATGDSAVAATGSNPQPSSPARAQSPRGTERAQPEPELLSGSTTVAGDLLNRSHDDTERGLRPSPGFKAPSSARPPYGSTKAGQAEAGQAKAGQGSTRGPVTARTARATDADEPNTDVTPRAALIGVDDLAKTAASPRIGGDDRSAKSPLKATETKDLTKSDPSTELRAAEGATGTAASKAKTATRPDTAHETAADSAGEEPGARSTTDVDGKGSAEGESGTEGEIDTEDDNGAGGTGSTKGKGSAARQWFVLAGQAVVAVVVGALLFKGFEQLWDVLPWVALVLSVLVIVGLVAVVRILRRTDDLISIVIAIAVGVFVTLGPLAFQLSTG